MKGWVVAAWHAMVTPPPVSSNTEMSSFTFCLFKPCIISTLLHTISTVLHNTHLHSRFLLSVTIPPHLGERGIMDIGQYENKEMFFNKLQTKVYVLVTLEI